MRSITNPNHRKDLARVMTRVKAIYRSWGIPLKAGKQVYAPRHRS